MLAASTGLPLGLYFPSDTQYELLLPTGPLPLSLAKLLLLRQLLPVADLTVLFGMFNADEFFVSPANGCSDGVIFVPVPFWSSASCWVVPVASLMRRTLCRL